MRVAIDGRALTGRYTGDRTYWRGLISALPSADDNLEFLVYSRYPIPAGELPISEQVGSRVLSAANERIWTLLALPAALRKDKADIVHVQYTTPPRMLCPCPIVTTVHDISFKLHPEWFPQKHRLLLNLTVPASMRSAARVITDSESSRRDILGAYDLPPEKVAAIPLGLPDGFADRAGSDANTLEAVLAKYGITQPYVLAVGVLQPRKNLKMLCEAFGRAKKRSNLPHSLVIAGKAGWETELETLRAAARSGGGDLAAKSLVFPGYIDDVDLPALYGAADAFAYPSLYEGFGLPPLEAMACGTPVLVSDAPCLPEISGEAAMIVPATDVSAWSSALIVMLTDAELRIRYIDAGLRRAACYSWDATAERTRSVYREAAGKR